MGNTNEALVKKGYEAFSQADLATLGALMTDDVVHVNPGNNPTAGKYQGQEEVFGYYGKLFELSGGTFKAEPKSITAQGDDVVVAVHRDTAQRGVRTVDVDETITFTVEDGKIARLESSYSDQAAVDAFWI